MGAPLTKTNQEHSVQAHVRYLALISEQPEIVAGYYATSFGLRELGRSEAGDITLSDGYYNLTIFRRRAGLGEVDDSVGLHHIGIAIDDVHELEGRLEELAPNVDITTESGDLQHGQYRLVDPSGLVVSLSTNGFGTPDDRRGRPAIHHAAVKVADTDALLDFYTSVFGFREVSSSLLRREQNWKSRFAGDGSTSLAILPLGENENAPGNIRRAGLNHFGFVVDDMAAAIAALPASGETARRPPTRVQAEFRTFDPDHNGIDISQQQGFEVDVKVWARAEA
jgi:catechol 2,3-dioxygenase-like lactoylglutathione lyase family enzyme